MEINGNKRAEQYDELGNIIAHKSFDKINQSTVENVTLQLNFLIYYKRFSRWFHTQLKVEAHSHVSHAYTRIRTHTQFMAPEWYKRLCLETACTAQNSHKINLFQFFFHSFSFSYLFWIFLSLSISHSRVELD